MRAPTPREPDPAHFGRRRGACTAFLALAVAALGGPIRGDDSAAAPRTDWPQFRGSERDGKAVRSPVLLAELPDGGLPVRWRRAVGSGFAPPVVADGRVLLYHRQGSECLVSALSLEDGTELWERSLPATYRDQFGFDDGPRSSPTVSDGRVYAYGAEGILSCLDLPTGEQLWAVDCAEKFDAPPGFFGRAGSPLVYEGLVLLNVGGRHEGRGAGIVALDARTGVLRWQATAHEAGYSSPVLRTGSDGPLALFLTRDGFVGLTPTDGRVVFDIPYRSSNDASVNAAMPVLCGDEVFISACYGVGASVWSWPEGDTTGKPQPRWREEGALDCHYATPVFDQGHLYGFHGRQETGQELRCVEAASGTVRWSSPDLRPGSLILADGKLVVATEDGELAVVAAEPDRCRILLRDQVLRRGGRPIPVFADGLVLVRDGRELVCVDLRRP